MDWALTAHLALRMFDSPALFTAMVVLWLVILGGSFGSFLNVVVYRLPLGLSLWRPGSRCPRCGTPISPRDNIPMLGWLLLRGRCRACRGPISPRYPLVELAAASAFTGLALAEPLGGGWNMPRSAVAGGYPLWGLLPYHFLLVGGLAAAALMIYDDQPVPRRFWRLLWGIGFTAAIVWPQLRPAATASSTGWSLHTAAAWDGVVGTLVGGVLGAAAWPAASAAVRGRSGHVSAAAASATVGVFLGRSAASGIVVGAVVVWAVMQLVRRMLGVHRNAPWLIALAAVTLGWLFAWRWTVEHFAPLGPAAPWHTAAAAATATFVAARAGRVLFDAVRRRNGSAGIDP